MSDCCFFSIFGKNTKPTSNNRQIAPRHPTTGVVNSGFFPIEEPFPSHQKLETYICCNITKPSSLALDVMERMIGHPVNTANIQSESAQFYYPLPNEYDKQDINGMLISLSQLNRKFEPKGENSSNYPVLKDQYIIWEFLSLDLSSQDEKFIQCIKEIIQETEKQEDKKEKIRFK